METQLELSMTHQKSESSEAKLTLSLTGNPWTDFGIVSLCEELRLSTWYRQEVFWRRRLHQHQPFNRTIVELKRTYPDNGGGW